MSTIKVSKEGEEYTITGLSKQAFEMLKKMLAISKMGYENIKDASREEIYELHKSINPEIAKYPRTEVDAMIETDLQDGAAAVELLEAIEAINE